MMGKELGYTVLDMKAISDQVKSKMGTEEEPFEGEVPLSKVEEEIVRQIEAGKSAVPRKKFVFRGFTHKNVQDFLKFIA